MSNVSFGAMVPRTQSDSSMSKKDPIEGVPFLSQLACVVVLRRWVSAFPEASIRAQQVVLATAPPRLKDPQGLSCHRHNFGSEPRNL